MTLRATTSFRSSKLPLKPIQTIRILFFRFTSLHLLAPLTWQCGHYYSVCGDYKTAEKYLLDSIEADPLHGPAFLNLVVSVLA